jgi:hypothetical protein
MNAVKTKPEKNLTITICSFARMNDTLVPGSQTLHFSNLAPVRDAPNYGYKEGPNVPIYM